MRRPLAKQKGERERGKREMMDARRKMKEEEKRERRKKDGKKEVRIISTHIVPPQRSHSYFPSVLFRVISIRFALGGDGLVRVEAI